MMVRRLVIFALAMLLIFGARTALSLLHQRAQAAPFEWAGLPGCEATGPALGGWQPRIINADHEIEASYRCAGERVRVHVAQYFEQGPDKEAVGGRNRAVTGSVASEGRRRVDSGAGFPVNAYRRTSGPHDDVVVWHWYGIGARAFTGDAAAKLAEARRLLTLHPTASTVFMVAGTSDAAVREAASEVWRNYLEQVQQ